MSELRRRLMMMAHDYTPIHFEDPEVKRICVENFGGLNGITNRAFGTIGVKGYEGEITFRQVKAVRSLSQVFNNSPIRKFNELKYFKVGGYYSAFNGCNSLEEVTLPSEIKPTTTDFRLTFANCVKLSKINGFSNIKKITASIGMFYKCESLEHIDFTGIDLSEIRTYQATFQNCINLKSINFDNNTFINCTNFHYIFNECVNLENLINFDYDTFGVSVTPNINRYFNGGVFYKCAKLINNEDIVINKITNFTVLGGDTFNGLGLKYFDFRNWSNLKGISFASFSDCRNNEGFTLPDVANFIIDGCFCDYSARLAKFQYNKKYIRFLSETPPEIRNNYPNYIALNWYVPSNAIQSYRDYIDSLDYFTAPVVIKTLEEWEADCDTFGWTKY